MLELLLLLTIPSRLLAMKLRYNVVLYCIMLCCVYVLRTKHYG